MGSWWTVQVCMLPVLCTMLPVLCTMSCSCNHHSPLSFFNKHPPTYTPPIPLTAISTTSSSTSATTTHQHQHPHHQHRPSPSTPDTPVPVVCVEATDILQPGTVLLAHPLLGDPRFQRGVVLVCAHDHMLGSSGVLLNKPTGEHVKVCVVWCGVCVVR